MNNLKIIFMSFPVEKTPDFGLFLTGFEVFLSQKAPLFASNRRVLR